MAKFDEKRVESIDQLAATIESKIAAENLTPQFYEEVFPCRPQ